MEFVAWGQLLLHGVAVIMVPAVKLNRFRADGDARIRVEVFKMRRGGGQGMAVHDDVADWDIAQAAATRHAGDGVILFDGQGVAAEADEAFDVKFVGRYVPIGALVFRDAFGLEDNDVAAAGRDKIVAEAIDEQMVAGDDFHFQYVVAAMKHGATRDSHVNFQVGRHLVLRRGGQVHEGGLNGLDDVELVWHAAAGVRDEPEIVRFAIEPEGLFDVEDEQAQRAADAFEGAVFGGFILKVGGAAEPFLDAAPAGGPLVIGLLAQVGQFNAVKGRLHRGGRNFEGLEE